MNPMRRAVVIGIAVGLGLEAIVLGVALLVGIPEEAFGSLVLGCGAVASATGAMVLMRQEEREGRGPPPAGPLKRLL